MGRWRFAVFIVSLVVLHLLLHLSLGLGSTTPPLLEVGALLAARRLRASASAGLGLVLGTFNDALSLTGFGAGAMALTVVAYLGARTRDLFEGRGVAFTAVYLFAGQWLYATLEGLLRTVRGGTVPPALAWHAAGQGIYAVVAGGIALWVYERAGGDG